MMKHLLTIVTLVTLTTKVAAENGQCLMEVDAGEFCPPVMSKQTQQRWRYNYTTQDCQKFEYKGCGGNENNFRRRIQCDRACGTPDGLWRPLRNNDGRIQLCSEINCPDDYRCHDNVCIRKRDICAQPAVEGDRSMCTEANYNWKTFYAFSSDNNGLSGKCVPIKFYHEKCHPSYNFFASEQLCKDFCVRLASFHPVVGKPAPTDV